MQLDKKYFPRLATLPSPAKSIDLNDMQLDKKLFPTHATLLSPAKSMEVNDILNLKKRDPPPQKEKPAKGKDGTTVCQRVA